MYPELAWPEDALDELENFLRDHGTSQYAEEIHEKLVIVRQRLADHEFFVATFYLEREQPRAAALRRRGIEVKLDTTNQKINAKVREHSLQRVPVIAVVGRKEAEQRTVALRRLGGEAQEVVSLDEAVVLLAEEAMAPDLKRAM